MNEKQIERIEKVNIKDSSKIFKEEILLNNDRINYLIELAKKNTFNEKKGLRVLAWKIFLGIIPEENSKSIEGWIDIIDSQRKSYKEKLEKYCSIKQFKSIDPLIEDEKKENEDFLNKEKDNSIINLINLDLIRTHQSLELFQKTKTKNILSNVLFIYSKETDDIPYGQGMNELVSMLYICLYPYYFPCKEKLEKDDIKQYLNDIESHYEDIYLYFYDEDKIQCDIYFLFKSLMSKGIKNLYGKDDIKKEDKDYNLYELFPDIPKDITKEERPTHLNLRSYMLIKEKLKMIDKKLYNHFKKININCNYFLHRWFKCIFSREFEINEVSYLWDKIFLYDFINREKYKYPLIYIDFICLAMIIRIRYQLIKKDEGDCFTILFHYPKPDDISYIIEISEKISKIFENKINNEEYDINEVFNLIKADKNLYKEENSVDGDANEELIISPHLYNQNNNRDLISCDNKNGNLVFCGKYYIQKRQIYIIGFCIILFCLFIWIYNKIEFNKK